jgi:sodium/potassium-transporting ATPase subunit alpha
VRFIAILAFVMGIIFFIIGMARGLNWFVVFITGFVTIIAANVPQGSQHVFSSSLCAFFFKKIKMHVLLGLPATVTSLLTLTAKRLRQCNMFVKRLDSVETLGAVNLIASDKTGTLTQNKYVLDRWNVSFEFA